MGHDFDQYVYDYRGIYQYRTYESDSADCRGLMDYIDDGVGWSKCSARDFSRYITSGGTKQPCIKKSKIINQVIIQNVRYLYPELEVYITRKM